MTDDITTDPNLGGRFTSTVTPSRWNPGWFEIEVTDNETGECTTGNLRSEGEREAEQTRLATQLLEQHKTEATEPDVQRFNLPAAEETNEIIDNPIEDEVEGETGSSAVTGE